MENIKMKYDKIQQCMSREMVPDSQHDYCCQRKQIKIKVIIIISYKYKSIFERDAFHQTPPSKQILGWHMYIKGNNFDKFVIIG